MKKEAPTAMQPPTNERTRLCKDGFSSLHTYSRNSGLYGVCCCCYGYGFCPESFSWLSLCSSCHVILTVHISILTFREQRSSQQSLESLFDAQSSQAPSSARSKLVISIYSLRVLLYMINPRRRKMKCFLSDSRNEIMFKTQTLKICNWRKSF